MQDVQQTTKRPAQERRNEIGPEIVIELIGRNDRVRELVLGGLEHDIPAAKSGVRPDCTEVDQAIASNVLGERHKSCLHQLVIIDGSLGRLDRAVDHAEDS